MVSNAKGRAMPAELNGRVFLPYESHLGIKPLVHREVGRVTRWRRPGESKVLSSIDEAIEKTGLSDGMTISFHHHLRNGDGVLNMVIERIRKKGIKNLRILPSAMFPVHEPIIEAIKDKTVSSIEGSLNGPVGRFASLGNMDEPVILRSHSGRVRAISQGELKIDVAFIAASCCDQLGNCNGLKGKSAFGPLAFGFADAFYAERSVVITDNLVPFPAYPISIPGTNIDYIVKVDSIGDPSGILSGTLKITQRPDHLKIVENTMLVMDSIGLLKDGFSFQAGAGGISLALTKRIGDLFREKGLSASYANGGTTRYLVDMLKNGTLKSLSTGQAFDLSAINSLLNDTNHFEITVDQYSNLHTGATSTEPEQAAFLGATEVDVGFNVNVNTHSDGYLLHGIGGHQDVAYGSQLTFITVPLSRKGNPIIKEKVTTISTPGELVDIVVTEKGLAVNTQHVRDEVRERNEEIEKALLSKDLPVKQMEYLRKLSLKEGKDIEPRFGDELIGLVKYIDGTVLDSIISVRE
ncbi:MAG TPA: citrate lyase subunit alpha [Euryarchaeota archaeon]|nr:MAG: citrate lyase subunit alpha [Thermoplasmatales archaeon ex4484_6]HHD16583.1 citrate lyase subunit alpha [Euryarchaeota archaeon]